MEKDLTILIPALNEEKTIEIVIKKAEEYIKSKKINGEILIANNGSIDGYARWCFGHVAIWTTPKTETATWPYGGRVGARFDGVGRDEWKIIVY